MERKGAVNWDTCQIASILANKRPGPAYHADCKLYKDIWQIVAGYYKDPCVYDKVPAEDWERCEDYIGPELLNAFLDIPGMVLAGGAAVPRITKEQMGDIDFFYQGLEEDQSKLKEELSTIWLDAPDRPLGKLSLMLQQVGCVGSRTNCAPDDAYIVILIDRGHALQRKSNINIIIRKDMSGKVPCITRFFMDYQQVMFEKVKDGRVRRVRTKLAVEAHRTKIVKAYSLVKCSYEKILHEESKLQRKGFDFPRRMDSIFYFPIKFYTDFWMLSGPHNEYASDMSSNMGSHYRPDFMSSAELEIRPVLRYFEVESIIQRMKESVGVLSFKSEEEFFMRISRGAAMFYILTGMYNQAFVPDTKRHWHDIRFE